MQILYFDLIGGVSGDMVVASLLDLCGSFNYLKSELKKIALRNYKLKFVLQKEGHIKMGRFSVLDRVKKRKNYQFKEIEKLIKGSFLSQVVKKNILAIYRALYGAEKRVHRVVSVHFHQVGEVDSIIDIASSCILIDRLKVDRILHSCVPFGKKVAPATAYLLNSKDIYFSNHPFENITPTGVAIITTLGFQLHKNVRSNFTLGRVGYGRGSFSSNGHVNGLRALILSKKKKKGK